MFGEFAFDNDADSKTRRQVCDCGGRFDRQWETCETGGSCHSRIRLLCTRIKPRYEKFRGSYSVTIKILSVEKGNRGVLKRVCPGTLPCLTISPSFSINSIHKSIPKSKYRWNAWTIIKNLIKKKFNLKSEEETNTPFCPPPPCAYTVLRRRYIIITWEATRRSRTRERINIAYGKRRDGVGRKRRPDNALHDLAL